MCDIAFASTDRDNAIRKGSETVQRIYERLIRTFRIRQDILDVGKFQFRKLTVTMDLDMRNSQCFRSLIQAIGQEPFGIFHDGIGRKMIRQNDMRVIEFDIERIHEDRDGSG